MKILILTSEKWIKVWGKCETVNHVEILFSLDFVLTVDL